MGRSLKPKPRAHSSVPPAVQSDALLAAIVDSSDDAIISKDLDGIITSWNPAAQLLFGYTAEEVIGQPLMILIPPERASEETLILSRLRSGERVDHFETVRVRKDGKRIEVSLTISPVLQADGEIIGFSKIVRDIIGRREAERALLRNEQLLSDFFENGAIGLHWVGIDGTILRANRTELELLGYSKDEYVGRHVSEFHVDPEVIDELLTRLRAGETLDNEEARMRCKDGSIKHVWITSNAFWENGKVVHYRCFVRDVTAQKQAEDQLRESEQRFRVMADSAPVLIWVSGRDKRRNYFNRTWLDFVGRTIGEEMGNGWQESLHPDDLEGYLNAYMDAFVKREPFEMEYRLRDHTGEYRWVLDRAVPRINLEGGFQGFVGGCIDVDARKRAKEKLEQEVAERTVHLRETIESLESVCYTIAHDLRTPLRAVQPKRRS